MSQTNEVVVEHEGQQVFFSVSPCSWRNKNYGLQVKFSTVANAVNAESEFIRDKSFEASDKPKDVLDSAAKELVEKWLAENGTALLNEHVEKWGKTKAAFLADFAQEEKRAAAAQKRADTRYKKKGYTHRVNTIIHPSQGDDYEVVSYVSGEPSAKDIAVIMRKSEIKTGYAVTAL